MRGQEHNYQIFETGYLEKWVKKKLGSVSEGQSWGYRGTIQGGLTSGKNRTL